ncbi:MAG: arginine repressor [Gammaproteobacteria bacterium]|nr:arginine repressor [Gammaproteobacteria bacterium]MDH3505515.1 arginine repressor [Gammaproteobacteria bacterium]
MPTAAAQQQARRRAIAELLERKKIMRQVELVRLLRDAGFDATQSSVSRDLKDLGVAKLTTGYELPAGDQGPGDDAQALQLIAEFVRELKAAGPHLLVVATAIGAAQRVAVTLDRVAWPEIVGTLSGDDTIFIATAGAAQQRRLVTRLREHLGKATS